ncbi:MAG: RNA binding S1 domain protein [Microgenomates group bacterium GW2011_GWC1_41_8]|nr:MAG: RNA binding S1 domain protein [Microgenomates group bacterium GW2011_GWC1_41_8]
MNKESLSKITVPGLTQLLKGEMAWISKFREGDVLEVTLLKKTRRYAFFDMGKFGTGIVFGSEMQNAKSAIKTMEIGEKVPARVEAVEGFMGYAELSLTEAGKQKLWQQVKDLEESGEIVKVKISSSNQGGLMADLNGLKAFLPISQLSQENMPQIAENDRQKVAEELKKFIGEEMSVKVINVNQRGNKLIISERESTSPSSNVKELLSKYTIGQTIDGVVSGIADFGVFVRFADNPEIEGLVHISEIDHRLIDSPKEVITLGESVKVKLIDIRDNRVFLSLKALKHDPWSEAEKNYKAGDEVTGIVHKFNPFGAIVEFKDGLQGMIHVSEFGSVDEMKKALELKQEYKFEISSLKPEEKRMILKMKK